MKKIAVLAIAAATACFAAPALADNHTTSAGFEIVERNAQGLVTKVSKDGQVIDVCLSDDQDGCINPRETGLNQGNWAIQCWPGQPASEMRNPRCSQ